jgi:mRNA interferase HigB
MNTISRPAIDAAIARHPESAAWLNAWWQRANHEQWTSLADVRRTYAQADQVGSCLVFNANAGRRLIVGVRYATQTRGGTLFVKHFLTHAEYDLDLWKKDCCYDD